jgi:hypothetical protein
MTNAEGPGDNENVDRLPVADGDQRAVQTGRSEAEDQKLLSWFVVSC